MFAGSHRDVAKAPARDHAVAANAALDRKEQQEHNPVWQSLALSSSNLQPKLAVSQPNDPAELEADRVADRVMRMASPQPFSLSRHSGHAQRKCVGCEEEEQVQRKEHAGADSPAVSRATIDHALRSPGRPLDETTRSFMEPRFGHDFSNVRVHDDSQSATSAEAVHAKAYTIGPHIVFGAGMYQPESGDGRRLLAHELAHTVQQGSSDPGVQRAPDDFRVTQVQPDPVERTKGMSDRFFFESEQTTFRATEPAEAAEKKRLEDWAAAHAGQHVKLVGRSSQEGAKTANKDIAQQRADTVSAILTAGGVIVDGSSVDMTYKQQAVEYRFYRSVEIIAGASTCTSFTATQQATDVTDCEAAFTAAHTRATSIVDAAMARLRPATDPAPASQPKAAAPARDSRDTILNARFPGITRATLLPLFESIVTRLGETSASAGHTCNHRCVNGCERAASAGPGGALDLCAPFYIPSITDALSVDERVFAVLHETTHSAVIPGSSPAKSVGIDFAYSTTRMFDVLEGSEALTNTDSYVMAFLALAESTASAPAVVTSRGKAPADTLGLTTPPSETTDRNRTARRAIGFAESWLNYSSFWAPNMYDYIAASLTTWSSDKDSLGHAVLELWAAPFKFNHPGTSGLNAARIAKITPFQTAVAARGFAVPGTSTHATQQDRSHAAGIYDRYSRMLNLLNSALTVDPAATGDGSWATATGLPGLGIKVQLADSFFTSLSNTEQARHIIRLMARAMSDVGATWVEAYVEGADGVRQFRGLGP
jgi:outer membrane protein OmpA-like peptidoglycan-associated protein